MATITRAIETYEIKNLGKRIINSGTDKTVSAVGNLLAEKDKKLPQYGKYKVLNWEFETPLIWTNIFFITLGHVIALYILLTHNYIKHWGIVIYGLAIGGIGGFGVTAGAHRYFTHKAYKATLPLKIILLLCYASAGQNSLRDWVRDHRVHHKFSETDADPHNSNRGFFFSHVGWLMMKKHPEVYRKGGLVEIDDIFEDPVVAFFQKYFIWFKLICGFVIPTLIPPFLYGETWALSFKCVFFVKYIVLLNSTWAVNSAAHIWGTKPYNEKIQPVENLTVSFFAMGEGYHNYHHTFPWDYRASELGRKMNVTTFWLNLFRKIGWAYDMKSASVDLVRKVIENKGDGSHYTWGHEVPLEENEKIKAC